MPTPEQDHSDADRQNTREYMANLERREMNNLAVCPTCNTEVDRTELRKCAQCLNRGCIYCTVTNGVGEAFCDMDMTGKLEDSDCYQQWKGSE